VALTLTEAREVVASHLDDVNNVRWSLAAVDRALASSLSRCLLDYSAAGGERFCVDMDVVTNGAGLYVFAAPVVAIRTVHYRIGDNGYYTKMPAQTAKEDFWPVNTVCNLRLRVVPLYTLPATPGDPLLVGTVGDLEAFDQWMCSRAALQLCVKDNDLRQALLMLEADARQSVLKAIPIPGGVRYPEKSWNGGIYDFQWRYIPGTLASPGMPSLEVTRRWLG